MSTIEVKTEITEQEYNALLNQDYSALKSWAYMDMVEKGYHPAGYGTPMNTRLKQFDNKYYVVYRRYNSCD